MAGERSLENRVGALERRMKAVEANGGKIRSAVTTIEAEVSTVKTDVSKIVTDTAEILALVSATKATTKFLGKHVGGFLGKHGPRMVAAISGAAVSAGLLNPKVGAFFTALFN